MPIVDDFYLLVHDEHGKPRMHARAAAIGLAAGVLADLILTGHITVTDRRITVPDPSAADRTVDPPTVGRPHRYTPPADPLGHTIWDQICREPPHQIRTWLGVLTPTITEAVAARLTHTGVLRPTEVGWLRRSVRYQPVDGNAGMKIEVVLAARLVDEDPTIDWPDAVLAGLLYATGLSDALLWRDRTGSGRRYLRIVMHGMHAQMPAFTDLFADTEAAVGDAVLTHRT